MAKLGAGLLIGAALAFPAGMMVAGSGEGPDGVRPPGREAAVVRDVFAPSIRSDPYFLDRQREGVEALERHCASTGESCAEARAARRRIDELDTRAGLSPADRSAARE